MATYHEIPRPERPKGTDEQKWQELYRYLYRLTEHLENIINNLTKEGVKNDGGVQDKRPI